jgi:L-rhamnose mutarotase
MKDYAKYYGDKINKIKTVPNPIANPMANPIANPMANPIPFVTDDMNFRILPAFQWLNDLNENAEYKKSNDDLLKNINSGIKTAPYKNISDFLQRTNKNAFSLVTSIYNFATKENKDKTGKPYTNEETQKYYDFLKKKLETLKENQGQDQSQDKNTIYNNVYNVLQKVLKNTGTYKQIKVGGKKKRTIVKHQRRRRKPNTKTKKKN